MDDAKFDDLISGLTSKDFVADSITPLEELKSNASTKMKCKMELFVTNLQSKVLHQLESYEKTKKFVIDQWNRPQGGGGITCVLQDGEVFEKAGTNISVLCGDLSATRQEALRKRGKILNGVNNNKYFAAGISTIIHPRNPFVPTIGMNYRYFEIFTEDGKVSNWWFGGGNDLTPIYLNEDDAIHFHKTQKEACDKHNKKYYPKFKKWADDYHYNQFRDEQRGIGGIFFDDLNDGTPGDCFDFIKSCSNTFLPYLTWLLDKHLNDVYTEENVKWQQRCRGRYIEYNLLCDRGIKFGFSTPGIRIESVLMCLPLNGRWEFADNPAPGSEEEKLVKVLKKPRDWV